MPLPVPFGLPGRELRDALGEVQHAEQRELRQRRSVHACRRGEDQVRSDQAGPLQEAAQSRAGALNPAQPRAVPWHAGRILPIKVEADVGLRPDPGPLVLLGRGELARHAGMIGGVPRRGDQAGLIERVHARVRVLDPSHQVRLERGGDEDAHGVGLQRSSPSQLSIVNDDYYLIASAGQPWAAYLLIDGWVRLGSRWKCCRQSTIPRGCAAASAAEPGGRSTWQRSDSALASSEPDGGRTGRTCPAGPGMTAARSSASAISIRSVPANRQRSTAHWLSRTTGSCSSGTISTSSTSSPATASTSRSTWRPSRPVSTCSARSRSLTIITTSGGRRNWPPRAALRRRSA